MTLTAEPLHIPGLPPNPKRMCRRGCIEYPDGKWTLCEWHEEKAQWAARETHRHDLAICPQCAALAATPEPAVSRLLWRARVVAKAWLARHTLVIEFCQDCGRRQPIVWTAPNELWAAVTECRLEPDMGGVLCPECFDRRATTQGRFLRWAPLDESNP